MRRAFYWFIPLIVALVAAAAFGAGFYSFLTGDTGQPVNRSMPTPASVTPATTIAPIILGDSLARGAGDATGLGIGGRLDAELKRRRVAARETVNIAVSGARTPDLLRRLESANVRRLLGEANVIILSIGGNDLWGGNNWREAPPPDPEAAMDQVIDRIDEIVRIVRAQNPTGRIFLIGLYNPFRTTPLGGKLSSLVTRWNARVSERFSADPNFTLVQTADIFSHRDRLSVDRFHPGAEAYELIARRIADAI